jgi:hypothetical protein
MLRPACKNLLIAADKPLVLDALSERHFPGRPDAINWAALWYHRRPYTDWVSALGGLAHDAQTPLPKVD